ncbi:MAG: hypothetical protein ACRD9W_04685, partial [Terriglobia bacterium]
MKPVVAALLSYQGYPVKVSATTPVANLIQRNAARQCKRQGFGHQAREPTMTLDTIMVLIAVTAMFATLAIVLGRADRQT